MTQAQASPLEPILRVAVLAIGTVAAALVEGCAASGKEISLEASGKKLERMPSTGSTLERKR